MSFVPRYLSNFFLQCLKKKFASKGCPELLEPFESLRNAEGGPVTIMSKIEEIHFNLALETYLLESVKPKVPVFFWWRNDRNVVIGRYQNPWKESNISGMKEDGVALARRFTGGGAVYQDKGNSCFSFFIPTVLFDVNKNNDIILSTLKKDYGIDGSYTGRNDLIVGGKKFSGAAFRHINNPEKLGEGLSLHHGTVLLNVDFSGLNKYLTPNKSKLSSKGVDSVVSRVVNLIDYHPRIRHADLGDSISSKFESEYEQYFPGNKTRFAIDDSRYECLLRDQEFQKYYSILSSSDWCYGSTPPFSHTLENRFNWGGVEFCLSVQNGYISEVELYTDMLDVEFVPLLKETLKGKTYDRGTLNNELKKLRETISKEPQSATNEQRLQILKELSDWLYTEMS